MDSREIAQNYIAQNPSERWATWSQFGLSDARGFAQGQANWGSAFLQTHAGELSQEEIDAVGRKVDEYARLANEGINQELDTRTAAGAFFDSLADSATEAGRNVANFGDNASRRLSDFMARYGTPLLIAAGVLAAAYVWRSVK